MMDNGLGDVMSQRNSSRYSILWIVALDDDAHANQLTIGANDRYLRPPVIGGVARRCRLGLGGSDMSLASSIAVVFLIGGLAPFIKHCHHVSVLKLVLGRQTNGSFCRLELLSMLIETRRLIKLHRNSKLDKALAEKTAPDFEVAVRSPAFSIDRLGSRLLTLDLLLTALQEPSMPCAAKQLRFCSIFFDDVVSLLVIKEPFFQWCIRDQLHGKFTSCCFFELAVNLLTHSCKIHQHWLQCFKGRSLSTASTTRVGISAHARFDCVAVWIAVVDAKVFGNCARQFFELVVGVVVVSISPSSGQLVVGLLWLLSSPSFGCLC